MVSTAPLEVAVGDLKSIEAKRQSTQSIDGWPIACNASGFCAFEESSEKGRRIVVFDAVHGDERRELDVGDDFILDLDISPDGQYLAAATNKPLVRWWTLKDGKEQPSLTLESQPDKGSLGTNRGYEVIRPKLCPILSGAATVVRFGPDNQTLAAANDTAIQLFDVSSRDSKPVLFTGYSGLITALAFEPNGHRLFSAGYDKVLRTWEKSSPGTSMAIGSCEEIPKELSVRVDGTLLAATFAGGKVEIWGTLESQLLLRLNFLPNGKGWIATNPEGLFDNSEGAWRQASWKFPNSGNEGVPLETYYLDYFESGLVREVLLGNKPEPRPPLQDQSRAVPEITIEETGTKPGYITSDNHHWLWPDVVHFRIAAHAKDGSGIHDLRVALNGTVYDQWDGELSENGEAVVRECDVKICPGDSAVVTAFGFNKDRVQSAEARWERKANWARSMPQRTLYLVAIGIGHYQNNRFDLEFPTKDADLFEKLFTISEGELNNMGHRLSAMSVNQAMDSWRANRDRESPTSISVTKLVDDQATRARILEVLNDVVKKAELEDSVIIFFSGHGAYDGYNYYLLPYDMQIAKDPFHVTEKEWREAAATLVSDIDMEKVLSHLSVPSSALIIDACGSGEALAGPAISGPFNSKSLARTAYEKGTYLLAATEAAEPAFELRNFGNSLLTYALLQDGLDRNMADFSPVDGVIELGEWLMYAAQRVPLLKQRAPSAPINQEAQPSPSAIEVPTFSPRRIPEKTTLVLRVIN